MSSNQIEIKNFFLNSSNTNRLKNVVFTQLSKEYNIQPMISTMEQKFGQIMNYISDKIQPDQRLSFDQNIHKLNNVLVDKATQGFRTILAPYAHKNNSSQNFNTQLNKDIESSKAIEQEMPDVND